MIEGCFVKEGNFQRHFVYQKGKLYMILGNKIQGENGQQLFRLKLVKHQG